MKETLPAVSQSSREPWHYNVFEGKPEWAVQLSRIRLLQRERQRLDRRRAERTSRALGAVT